MGRQLIVGLAVASIAAAQSVPAELSALAAKAKLGGPLAAWCRAEIRAGQPSAFAVALTSAGGGGRYLVELHYIDASDELCKRQLKQRSKALPAGSAWTSDAEFDLVTAYFQPPADDEHFNVMRRERIGGI